MWIAFVFFGSPAKIYFVEGKDLDEARDLLKNVSGFEGKINHGKSDIFTEDTWDKILDLFKVTEEMFSQPQVDPIYYKICSSNLKQKNDGEFCKLCKNFFPMAVPNQLDGSMICWSCRNTRGLS